MISVCVCVQKILYVIEFANIYVFTSQVNINFFKMASTVLVKLSTVPFPQVSISYILFKI